MVFLPLRCVVCELGGRLVLKKYTIPIDVLSECVKMFMAFFF